MHKVTIECVAVEKGGTPVVIAPVALSQIHQCDHQKSIKV